MGGVSFIFFHGAPLMDWPTVDKAFEHSKKLFFSDIYRRRENPREKKTTLYDLFVSKRRCVEMQVIKSPR